MSTGWRAAMHRAGHEVVLITRSVAGTGLDAIHDGVRVLRVDADMPWLPTSRSPPRHRRTTPSSPPLPSLGDWRPDIVHSHDWGVAWAADVLATLFVGADRHHLPRHRAGPSRRSPPARAGDRHQQRRVVAGVPLAPGDRQHAPDGARDRRRVRDGPRPRQAGPARHRPGVVGGHRPRRARRVVSHRARAGVGPGALREGLPRARPGGCRAAVPGRRGSSA